MLPSVAMRLRLHVPATSALGLPRDQAILITRAIGKTWQQRLVPVSAGFTGRAGTGGTTLACPSWCIVTASRLDGCYGLSDAVERSWSPPAHSGLDDNFRLLSASTVQHACVRP